ncbi:hypothetical protein SDC9_195187 [bioreactor metagenome]|uniref:Adenylosuccinate lyase C-terminal domain-containing protein n=1 Tax=bioreactor metagenome TaxID=1076179 RepID=A0A645IH00_9ZZZZ
MAGVSRGGDRQALHEVIRKHSLAAKERLACGEGNDLSERLAGDPAFPLSLEEIQQELDPKRHIGRSVEQTERFLEKHPVPASTPLQEILV